MPTSDISKILSTDSHLGSDETQSVNKDDTQYSATGKSMQSSRVHFDGAVYLESLREEYSGKMSEESEGENREKIRIWLLGKHVNNRYSIAARNRLEGTCDWILENTEFKNWRLDLPISPKLFWISGPAGFGKTFLCARIIESIEQQETVAHYFFSSDLENYKDPMVAMQSWIYQMAEKNTSVANIVNRTRERGLASQTVIFDIFRQAIKTVSNCTLAIDGLDECVPDSSCLSVAEFIKEVNKAVRNTKTRILVMSRPEPNIRQALKELTSAVFFEYQVDEKDFRPDIEAVSKHISTKKLLEKDLAVKDDLITKMSDQCEDQFLWLKLQQDSLPGELTQDQLQNALGEIPAGLSKLYDQSWKNIAKLPSSEQDRAISLLRLATFSLRPLTVREISEAVLVSEDHKDFPTHLLPGKWDKQYVAENILDLCYSLLEVRKPSEEFPVEKWRIHPIHFSVKEFLLRSLKSRNPFYGISRSMIEVENSSLAKRCITYMDYSYAWQDSTSNETPSLSAFTTYAAKFWRKHVEAGAFQQDISVEKFFSEKRLSWSMWRNWFESTNTDWADTKSDRDPSLPLCYAIELGFVDLAKDIIMKGRERVDYNSGSRKALGVACSKGYGSLARELLAHGAEVGVRDARGRTGAYYAAMNGHSELLKLLIDNGADINLQDYNGVSPFLAASSNGHVSIMRQLIQKGADIHQLDENGEDALLKASYEGHVEAAKLLIEKGAHRQLSSYTTPPVFVALRNGSSRLARLLVEKEKNLNATTGTKRTTILHVAVSVGDTDIAKLLIERGANPTLRDADGRTPLFVACFHGHVEVVKLLIQKKFDITTFDKEGETPLYAACANRQVEVARLLLDNGADSKSSDTAGHTPLSAAASGGSIEIIQMLTNAIGKAAEVSIAVRNHAILAASTGGHVDVLQWLVEWLGDEFENLKYEGAVADTAVKCNTMDAALLLASEMGHASVVQLLLNYGANLRQSDASGRTPLYVACCNGHLQVAKLLIEEGADIKATEKEGQTPLTAACANGCLVLVKLLLEKGAEVNTVNNGGMGAAFAAAQYGHLEVLRLLFSRGADIFRRNDEGRPLIHAAARSGHTKTVDFLIENGSDFTGGDRDGKSLILLACSHGKVDVVDLLLKHGVDVDAKDSKGRTPLLIASRQGDIELAELLVDHCANISIADDKGRTPLFSASTKGHLEIVKLLLDNGADMTPSYKGQTPDYMASVNGQIDILRLLRKSRASNPKNTPLHAPTSSPVVRASTSTYKVISDTMFSVIDAENKYEPLKDNWKLEQTFHAAAGKLLLIVKALRQVKPFLPLEAPQIVIAPLDLCKTTAEKLEAVFDELSSVPTRDRLECYATYIKRQGRGSLVEALVIEMMEHVFQMRKNYRNGEAIIAKLRVAIDMLKEMSPSDPMDQQVGGGYKNKARVFVDCTFRGHTTFELL